ncbi:MAG: hypothetical protein ACYS0F_08900 [Planctomycetota bacterium]|jgi:hypothetical protein
MLEDILSTDRLFRLGGMAAVIGGGLMVLDVMLHLLADDTLRPTELGGLAHELWHLPGMVALPMALLGLVAIYLKQSTETGRLGLWGFFLLVIGMTVGAIYSTLFHGIFLVAIENLEAGLFERLVNNTTAAQFYRGFVVQALGLGLGAILFGVATIRAKVFRTAAGWMFVAAALFSAANEVLPGGQLIGRTLFGAAFLWLGVELRGRTQAN